MPAAVRPRAGQHFFQARSQVVLTLPSVESIDMKLLAVLADYTPCARVLRRGVPAGGPARRLIHDAAAARRTLSSSLREAGIFGRPESSGGRTDLSADPA
jgi:hypothetical protein